MPNVKLKWSRKKEKQQQQKKTTEYVETRQSENDILERFISLW